MEQCFWKRFRDFYGDALKIMTSMNKELRAIVWLGALLGGIIGIVNSIS